MELVISVNEDLPRKDQRNFVKNYLTRALPGTRYAFMSNGSLRDDVKLKRFRGEIRLIR